MSTMHQLLRAVLLTAIGVVVVGAAPAGSKLQTSLIPVGAKWKFLADGSDQGTAWRAPDFDDSAWSEGPAKLGFGDDDVVTVAGEGSSADARVTTVYFRHTFNVVDARALNNFLVRLQRDDGAVVYLNGVEIYRNNMPAGEVTAATFAATAVAGADEGRFVSKFFKDNHLVEGRNVLAVEVHQSDAASSDLGFNLELLARFQLSPPTVSISSPSATDVVVEGPVTVVIDAAFTGGEITAVTLHHGDILIGETTSAPFEFSWTADPGSYQLTARVTTSEGINGVSVPVALTVAPALIRQGAVWKYLADGSNQGRAWREVGFDDSQWSEGRAELGYGDGDETTVVPSGADSSTNYITTYFRASFTVDDPSLLRGIEGLLTYDDGAVVYLNGTEVFRINMPPGDPAFNAPAIEGSDYEPVPIAIDARHLRKGTNVVAVEMHQSSASSSDISFDLMLRAARGGLPAPVSR